MKINDVCLIIRSSNERTFYETKKTLTEFGKSPVTVVAEKPFSKTFITSIEHAIEENKPWTLMVDADVLTTNVYVVDPFWTHGDLI